LNYADLHTHTTASDGLHTPTENVHMAERAGLSAVAITDHDTVAGLAEAAAAGEYIGITVVPGVEISTVANGQDIHILGYYIDYSNDLFLKRLEQLRETRERRNEMMIERLQQLGFDITMEEVRNKAGSESPGGAGSSAANRFSDETVGRPHMADVMIKKGYVASMKEAFDLYLGRDGKAYVNPPRINPTEAVNWIHEAGGTAVIAHPGLYHDDTVVEELIRYGVEGIEVYHSDHSPDQEAHYLAIAQRHNLIVTAGSDFHGERAGEVFHGRIGSKKINAEVIERLRR
jgi:predicted metal-dependent phosphoesterase TrpH